MGLFEWWRIRTGRAGWGCYRHPTDPRFVAVAPQRDLVEHDLYDEQCVCGPTLRVVQGDHPDGWVLTHEALDGRP